MPGQKGKAQTVHQFVGRRVAELRKGRGLTQAELGERLGWSSQVISFVEAGKRQLDLEELLLVARALDLAGISLLLPAVDVRVKVGNKTLDADELRDAVMGNGAAAQRAKVLAEAQANAEEQRRLLQEFANEVGIPWKEA
jgi:transcriptional regulator with XRE-family HTH domain